MSKKLQEFVDINEEMHRVINKVLDSEAFDDDYDRWEFIYDYVFSDEVLESAYSVEGSKKYTKRNLPLFWKLKEKETAKDYDKKNMQRYWKEIYEYGNARFLMYSQWYADGHKAGAQKEDIIRWYYSLISE